jgi:hypothetical protein
MQKRKLPVPVALSPIAPGICLAPQIAVDDLRVAAQILRGSATGNPAVSENVAPLADRETFANALSF